MKHCNSCYFSNRNSVFCHKGYPHWAFRVACDEYYAITITYGSTTTTTSSYSHTTTASETKLLSDEYVDSYLRMNSNHSKSE